MGDPNGSYATSAVDRPRTSALAVWALVLSLIPICGLTQIAGLVMGIIALSKIGDSQGRLKGRGLALAAVILSICLMVLLPIIAILAGMLLPALAHAREEARKAACMSNLKQIGIAFHSYHADKKTWPITGKPGDGAGTMTLLLPDYVYDARVFQCPSARPEGLRPGTITEEACSYVFNHRTPERPFKDWMMAWDKDNHARGRNVLFGDGHVQWMNEQQFQGMLTDQARADVKPAVTPVNPARSPRGSP